MLYIDGYQKLQKEEENILLTGARSNCALFMNVCPNKQVASNWGICSRYHQERNGGTAAKRKLCLTHECTKQVASNCKGVYSRHHQENRGKTARRYGGQTRSVFYS